MTPPPESFEDLLREGLAALRAGDRALATSLLSRAVRSDPRSERAWLFLAGAVTDPAQRRSCLERVLSLNPQSEAARQGLRSLAPAPAAPAPAAPAPAAPAPAAPAPATVAAATIPLPAQAAPPAAPRAPASAEQVMSILSAAPAPATPPAPPPEQPPPPAMSTTMRLPPAFVALDVEPPAPARRPADRLIWRLIFALGLMLMLGSAAYTVILLRG